MSRFLKDCDICRRLGKSQCGYHRFKSQCLTRMANQKSREKYGGPTEASVHGTSGYVNYQSRETVNQSYNGYRKSEIYQNSSRVENNIDFPQQTIYRQQNPFDNVHVRQGPPSQIYQQGHPPQNHIVQVQNGQVLYYPIYPVYEVVYEPVNTSVLSSPSRVYYD